MRTNIEKLDAHKAVGVENFLKMRSNTTAQTLWIICNKSFETGVVPEL